MACFGALFWLAASAVHAELADGRFGSAQAFDVQRSPAFPFAGSPFTLSNLQQPYSDNTGNPYAIASGQYIKFFKVQELPECLYGINLRNADGTLDRQIAPSGRIWGLGAEGLLHTSLPGDYGTFVSNGAGRAIGDSVTYTPDTAQANCTETAAYRPSTTPTSTVGPIARSAVTAIPALSGWGLLLSTVLLATGAGVVLSARRRQR